MTCDQVSAPRMISDSAELTKDGILYGDTYYTSAYAIRNQWFMKARTEGGSTLPIQYDPVSGQLLCGTEEPERFVPCQPVHRRPCSQQDSDNYYRAIQNLKEELLQHKKKQRRVRPRG